MSAELSVQDYLNAVDYEVDPDYVPSDFALEFVNFIKLVDGGESENKTPVVHYHIVDNFIGAEGLDTLNMCHRGIAKLQSGSSRILTESGWRTMRSLQVGDYVVNRYGNLTRITYKTAPMRPQMYKMTLSDGTVLEVGDEHRNLVVTRQGGYWKEKVLTTTELLAKGVIFTTQRKQTKDGKAQYRFRIPLTKPVAFSRKDLPVHAYTLGLAIANAYFKGGVLSCHADDLDETVKRLTDYGDRVTNPRVNTGNAASMYIGKGLFKEYGSVTSRYKRIPHAALYGSIAQRKDLLRGLMDGDGSIAKNGGCTYSTQSQELANDVVELVQGLGGIATAKGYERTDPGRDDSRTCYIVRIKTSFNPFHLFRKACQWTPSKVAHKLITAIEPMACEEEGYCIMVDSPDHTYLTEGYTVTHNSTLKEYLILYLGVFSVLPGFGAVPYGLYISDSIDNGVKKMRKSLEFRWNNSEFLQNYIPEIKFTDIRWEFINRQGKSLVFSGYGAKTGVRGTRENGSRPVLALLDDLISDSDARSATVIADVEDTIYKAIDYALHPKKRKIIWSGTPFNMKDPLYKAVESGAWAVNVYPVCERFPCTREEFRGSWPDRFDYDYVNLMYRKALKSGKLETFNQELMLQIMSEEDRLVLECDISWYKRATVLANKYLFNFYITTDFATSEHKKADFSVISVWAYNSNGDWLWVDGIVKKQLMDANINDLFRLAQIYKPQQVGIEVSGQQGGFIPWLQDQMLVRNCYFALASENNNGKPGIRPNTQKMVRFHIILPLFKANKVFLPEERRDSPEIIEALEELRMASLGGFKSKHDDFLDTCSMLSSMTPWKPSEDLPMNYNGELDLWEMEDEEMDYGRMDSYVV